ncbi:MAG: tRNA 2-thiouridine(34) synthase MnmA [Treponema sp.]|nr:tRNA 2-thiouridine(34) synthase MnmA [Treponema sp.]
MPAKALIAMSGGVDSSVAAVLTLENGYQCMGVTLKLHDASDTAVNDAREAAEKLGIPHEALEFTESFRDEVILPFIESYEEGATPNPCVICNRRIKFGHLFSHARQVGCEILVTGHYAQTEKSGSRWLLKKALDPKKDQSYVLYSLGQDTLANICFPLGNLSKSEVREIARARGLASATRQESQDICYIPNGDYGAFMEAFRGKPYPPGDILDMDGIVIGRHRGLIRYTLGQRRGLGVAANLPVYVVAKDVASNTITLGPESALYKKTLTANRINLIACEKLDKPVRVTVKTRYLQQEKPAWAVQTGPDEIRIDFDEGQRALTPGQSAVLYDGDVVVGGGIIRSAV